MQNDNKAKRDTIRADTIRVGLDFDGGAQISIHYGLKDGSDYEVPIVFPYHLVLSSAQLQLVGIVGGIVGASACLAKNIVFEFPCDESMIDSAAKMVRILYDVCSYQEQIQLVPLPDVKIRRPIIGKTTVRSINSSKRRAYLLWSGGKDSTLSLLLLRSNSYDVVTTHVTANEATKHYEHEAVVNLSQLLHSPTETIDINSDGLVKLTKSFSSNFGSFPVSNTVLYGRDFLLLTLLSLLSYNDGCLTLCTGSEYDLYHKRIHYLNSIIHRHEAQSEEGLLLIENLLSKWISAGFRVFSPVSPLTEYKTFDLMLRNSPEVLPLISSCFWGRWCGKCFKCFRYYLLQTAFGTPIWKFEGDPLTSPFFQRYLYSWQRNELTYWEEINYCLMLLCQKDQIVESSELNEYRQHILPVIYPRLKNIYRSYLAKYHDIRSLPGGFDALAAT